MLITTAGRTNKEMITYAKEIAEELQCDYYVRKDLSITVIQQQTNEDVLVVGKNRLEIHTVHGVEPFFFHPNSAMFRVKRLQRGEHDPFVDAAQLQEGMSVLDCTLGMGSDSIVASHIVGTSGHVIGIEGNMYSAYVVQKGLQKWQSGNDEVDGAMRRVEVQNSEYLSFLQSCEDNSFDVVYFDPMFEENIPESDGIKGLKHLALYTDVTEEIIEEAKRVARQRIVLKDHYKSERFARFGFDVYKRKTAKFHFGVFELGEKD
jgi:16S rRNA G966 N2-methylase RsmD